MARNALEAVFGALGGGLVGYGKDKKNRYDEEQDAIEREERRKRTELADVLKAAEMVQSGSYGTESQLQASQQGAGRTAIQAAMFAATAGKGPPSAAPMPTDVARAVPQLRRGMDAPSVSIGGQNLRLLETETDRAQATRAARMEDAAVLRQQDRQDKAEDNAARTKRELEVAQARVPNTGLKPTDRAYAATLQFARTPTSIDTFTGERTFPDQQEVAAFAQQAKDAESAVYRTPTSAPPIRASTDLPPNETVLKRQRDEAIANVDARLISTAQKERLKTRIEDAYQADLARLGTPR